MVSVDEALIMVFYSEPSNYSAKKKKPRFASFAFILYLNEFRGCFLFKGKISLMRFAVLSLCVCMCVYVCVCVWGGVNTGYFSTYVR